MNRRTETVVPFRRTKPAAGPAAGSDPPPLPAPFVDLGEAVQAVVLNTANKRLRLKVTRADHEREDGGAGR